MIILDTDAITFIVRQKSATSLQLRNRLAHLGVDHEIVTTVITYEEQTRGWMKEFTKVLDAQGLINAYDDLLDHLRVYRQTDVIPYTAAADLKYHELRKQKTRVGTRDLRIAAIALVHDATLFTRNFQHFRQVPHLRLEDWTRA